MGEKTNNDLLNEYIKDLSQTDAEATKTLYQTVLTLSSGALGLSITFLTKDFKKGCLPELFSSWFCFGVAIMMMLFSYYLQRKALIWQFKRTEQYLTGKIQVWPDPSLNPENQKLEKLYLASAILFVIGTVLTALYMGGVISG